MSLADITKCVSNEFGLDVSELMSNRQNPEISTARGVACLIGKKHTRRSYNEIAKSAGYAERTGAMSSIPRVEGLMKASPELTARVEKIQKLLLTNLSKVGKSEFDTHLEKMMLDMIPEISPVIVNAVKSKLEETENSPKKTAIVESDWISPDSEFVRSVAGVVGAITTLENDKFSRGEALAMRKLNEACLNLRAEFLKMRNQSQNRRGQD